MGTDWQEHKGKTAVLWTQSPETVKTVSQPSKFTTRQCKLHLPKTVEKTHGGIQVVGKWVLSHYNCYMHENFIIKWWRNSSSHKLKDGEYSVKYTPCNSSIICPSTHAEVQRFMCCGQEPVCPSLIRAVWTLLQTARYSFPHRMALSTSISHVLITIWGKFTFQLCVNYSNVKTLN